MHADYYIALRPRRTPAQRNVGNITRRMAMREHRSIKSLKHIGVPERLSNDETEMVFKVQRGTAVPIPKIAGPMNQEDTVNYLASLPNKWSKPLDTFGRPML